MIPIEEEERGRLDYLETVLAAAKGSVGSLEYQNVFIRRPGGNENVTNDGEFSCAISTTAIYHRFGLLNATHTTVDGFEEEAKSSDNWMEIDALHPGAIGILEGKQQLDGTIRNRHTFIYIGDNMVVHNGLENGVWAPRLCTIGEFKHHTGKERCVETVYQHKWLV